MYADLRRDCNKLEISKLPKINLIYRKMLLHCEFHNSRVKTFQN
jgi:hypothetical protein